MTIRRVLATALGLILATGTLATQAQPLRLGELNSYKVFPAFLEP